MLNKVLGILAAVACMGGVAQAQTTTIVNDSYYSLPVLGSAVSFDVTSPSSLFIEGAEVSSPSIAGVGVLSGPEGYSEVFSLTNGTVSPTVVFNSFTLTNPGEYSFEYIFGNTNGLTSGTVGITATVTTPVPEPQTYAMLLAGLFIVGFTTRRRLLG